ncbi:MAG: metal ABC transporter substrate-binding protein [Acidobacteria bacterium]|nr:metal ABC transporter substrate-binding protein [Acidobacteriota bacterium]
MTTTLTMLSSIAEAIGGDRVSATSIAAPGYNPHFIEPRPSDILRLGRSDYFIHMGLDLELWRGPLVEAAVNPRLLPGAVGDVDASVGIDLLEVPGVGLSRASGDIHIFGNPHYWLDPENVKRMAEQFAGRLAAGAPGSSDLFRENLRSFSRSVDEHMASWKSALSPFQGQRLVAYHNSWPYFAHAFNLRIDLFVEPKPGISPSGSHLEGLVAQMKRDEVRIIIVEPFQPRRIAESVAKRTSGKVVELWQNPSGKDSYIEMMDRNVHTLVEALRASRRGSAP